MRCCYHSGSRLLANKQSFWAMLPFTHLQMCFVTPHNAIKVIFAFVFTDAELDA